MASGMCAQFYHNTYVIVSMIGKHFGKWNQTIQTIHVMTLIVNWKAVY